MLPGLFVLSLRMMFSYCKMTHFLLSCSHGTLSVVGPAAAREAVAVSVMLLSGPEPTPVRRGSSVVVVLVLVDSS